MTPSLVMGVFGSRLLKELSHFYQNMICCDGNIQEYNYLHYCGNYTLCNIGSSALTYMRADIDIGGSEKIDVNNLKYHVLGEKLHIR